jgi:hypothetical protein
LIALDPLPPPQPPSATITAKPPTHLRQAVLEISEEQEVLAARTCTWKGESNAGIIQISQFPNLSEPRVLQRV